LILSLINAHLEAQSASSPFLSSRRTALAGLAPDRARKRARRPVGLASLALGTLVPPRRSGKDKKTSKIDNQE